MDLLVTLDTDRKLFSVERSQNGMDACGLLCADFTNMADMVHFHVLEAVADTAWHSQS